MKPKKELLIVLSIFFCGTVRAEPLSLTGAFEDALRYDARLRMAQAETDATRQEIGKARAGLLPSIQANAGRGRNHNRSTVPGFSAPVTSTMDYNSVDAAVTLKQPLINLAGIAEYRQARAVAAKSESLLHKEQSGLIMRTAEAFFNVLYAEENLEFTRSQVKAAEGQLQQAKKRFREGYGTITEVNEAEASYDMALADDANNVTSLDFYRRELERITGIYTEKVCRLVPDRVVLSKPDPGNVEHWISLAVENNPEVGASRQEVRIAEREVSKSRSARFPTVELLASRIYQNSANNYTIGSRYDTYSLGVQVSMPIFTSGYVSSSISQSISRKLKAQEQLRMQEQSTVSDVRKFYNGMINSIAQVKAYEQAVKSQDLAVSGAMKGYLAGFRTNVDVLNSQQKLLESRRNLAKSRYTYILNLMSLKDAVGSLTSEDVRQVNAWLQ
jgi:protease secretion system outer membrane protein